MSYEQTIYWNVDENINMKEYMEHIKEAALWIKKGEVIAFPTETVYGLGADALNEQAVQKIFTAKGRPSDNPLIVHIAEKEQLKQLVAEIPSKAEQLIERFWPGPLTIIFRKKAAVAPSVTAGLQTVAVRMPDHDVALSLLKAANVPVAAPSANVSGKPSPTIAKHVYDDLNGKIAGIVDGGMTGVGLESTVIDCTKDVAILYRPGGVTKEEIEAVIGPIEVEAAEVEKPSSPGMKYKHYAPAGTMYVVTENEQINDLVAKAQQEGKKVGVLTTEENKHTYNADVVISCGKRSDLTTIAHNLYDSLRAFDHQKTEIIYAETFPNKGLGQAIMNRLSKAAGYRVL